MIFNCFKCDNVFTIRSSLQRHLSLDRCKGEITDNDISNLLITKEKEYNKEIDKYKKEIKELKEMLEKVGDSYSHNNHTNIHSNNVNIIIQVQPIDKLNLDYIHKEYLQKMFDKLNKDQSGNMDLVLKKYIQSIIANPDHPENHAVKYTKKDPPMFSTLITDDDNIEKRVVNDLKDTCDLISEPLIEQMLKKIKESWREFRQDPDFDETMDVNLLEALRDKLKNENVRRILKRFIKSDILENVQMRIEKTEPEIKN